MSLRINLSLSGDLEIAVKEYAETMGITPTQAVRQFVVKQVESARVTSEYMKLLQNLSVEDLKKLSNEGVEELKNAIDKKNLELE